MQIKKYRVLFLCTGNSCRSQMAEGWARRLLQAARFEVYSAGIEARGLDPQAVLVMKEAGVDISAQHSKEVKELDGISFDVVITVCGGANEQCPVFTGAPRVLHFGFDDPPGLAAGTKDEQEALGHYRRVRDEIKEFILKLPVIIEGS